MRIKRIELLGNPRTHDIIEELVANQEEIVKWIEEHELQKDM